MDENFESTIQKSKEIIKQVMQELRYESERDAQAALRAVLHTLRDRLTVEEAADFAAQLPLLLKGVFYDGWKPGAMPVKMGREEFLAAIRERSMLADDPERLARSVFQVLADRTAHGELRDMISVLPKDVGAMIRDAIGSATGAQA